MPTINQITDSKTGVKYDLEDTVARNDITTLKDKVVKVVANPAEESSGKLFKVQIGNEILEVSGSGSGGFLENDLTTNVEVGGIPVGTKFAAGTNLEAILNKMLVKYKNPTVTLTLNITSPRAKWNPITSVLLTASTSKGTNNIASVDLYSGSTVVNSLADSGSFTYTPASPISTDVTFKAVVKDTEGKSGDNSKTVSFVLPYYYGTSASESLADLSTLTEDVSARGTKTYKFSGTEKYIYFACDNSYPDLSGITDSMGFDNTGNFQKTGNMTITAADGKNYTFKIYRSKTVQSVSNFSLTFK